MTAQATATAERVDRASHILDEGGTAPLSLIPVADQPMTVIPQRGVTPGDLLNLAMQSGDQDIARLERLMQMDLRYRELQEQDRKRDAEIAFENDFVGFTGENVTIPKTKPVDRAKGGKFMQAEFDSVCLRLKPALSKHGFGFRHKEVFGSKPVVINSVESNVAWVWVVCILSHKGGHKDILELDGPADDQTANSPVQNAQSTASYLKRQSLLAITGTATGGEDDESAMRGRAATGAMQTEDAREQQAARQEGVLERFAAATTIQELSRVMNALTMDEKKQFTPAFNKRREELKGGAQ